ncbi:hypothetical protein [Chitinimonas sp.]|uniref:hypothetical protein n=1 Tax=Chitinimonas sp. TaxID=1934313 RepID=UPI002F958A0C
MKTAIKLLSASLFGLAVVHAAAADKAPVFAFSEDAYNTQFVSPDHTDAFRTGAIKAQADDTIVIAGKTVQVSPDNTDAFRRIGYTGADLLANSRTGREAFKVAAGSPGPLKVASVAVAADAPWYSVAP